MSTIIPKESHGNIYGVILSSPDEDNRFFEIKGRVYTKQVVDKYKEDMKNFYDIDVNKNIRQIFNSRLPYDIMTSREIIKEFPPSKLFVKLNNCNIHGIHKKIAKIPEAVRENKDTLLDDVMEILHLRKQDAETFIEHARTQGKSYIDGFIFSQKAEWEQMAQKGLATIERINNKDRQKTLKI